MFGLAWAAGLFEGEGSFSPRRDKRNDYVRPVAQMKSTDEDVVRSFHKAVILGRVTGPYSRAGHPEHKPYWHWQVSVAKDYSLFCIMVFPYMHSRRKARMIEVAQEVGLDDLALTLKTLMEEET